MKKVGGRSGRARERSERAVQRLVVGDDYNCPGVAGDGQNEAGEG